MRMSMNMCIILSIIHKMDELKQIITHKLKLIQTYRNNPPNSQTPEQQSQTTELFLKQKRKQNSRDVIESRLLQNLSNRKIEAPYRIQEFYGESLDMMRMYDPGFGDQGMGREREGKEVDQIGEIVELYVEFFRRNQCERRADQIKNLVKKNLCQRGMIIPTIFNWFVEWLRKSFRDFIKKTLNECNDKKNNSLIEENKKKRQRKFMEEINVQRASLSLIDSEIKVHKEKELSLRGNQSRLLSPNYGKLEIKAARAAKSQLLTYAKPYEYLSMSKLKPSPTQPSPQKQPTHPISARQYSDHQPAPPKQKQKQKPSLNLNKDIFFSAFYDEMAQYYKLHSILGELDENYPRNFRKVDRREEINRHVGVLVKSVVRNQPNQLKASIEDYLAAYRNKFGGISLFQAELQQMRVKVKKKRAESVDICRQTPAFEPKKNTSFEQPPEKKNPRQQAQKRKIELQLPAINPRHSASLHKSVDRIQKIIVLNGDATTTNRYSKQRSPSQRVSAELYKELREISSLFRGKKNNRESLEILDQDLCEMKNNSIRYKKRGLEKDQIGELLNGNFQDNGIFRLPKICKGG